MNIELVKLNEENFALALRPQGERDAFQLGQLLASLNTYKIECKVEGTGIYVKINKYGASVHSIKVKDTLERMCKCGHTKEQHDFRTSELDPFGSCNVCKCVSFTPVPEM